MSAQAKEHSGTPKQNGTFSTSNTGFLKKNNTLQAKENTQCCVTLEAALCHPKMNQDK